MGEMGGLQIKLDWIFFLTVGLILLVNIIGFIIIGVDKHKAKKKLWRVPEKIFFLIAFFGGSVGVYAGMFFFRHKTKHWYFVLGIPFILIAEAIAAFYLANCY